MERSLQNVFIEIPDLESILEQLEFDKHTFFCKADHPLSQWYPAEFVVGDFSFNCAEQYMMFEKAMFFNDWGTAERIMQETEPKRQKERGREVTPFDETAWNNVCKGIVFKGNYAKFSQNPELLEQLLATTDTLIVEANPRDTIWGIGMTESEAKQVSPEQWKGRNLLGKILTVLREQFIQGVI